MDDKQHHVPKKFPEKSQAIARLMEEDPEFVAMSEDYDACINALRYWEQSKEPEAESRVREYRALVQELEEEIRVTLEAQPLD
ncbi:MAG: hypothetical protein PVF76_11485 [Syntrophobacterales bacterium]|jgi:hypothetical protein